jgi:hypothetical protein
MKKFIFLVLGILLLFSVSFAFTNLLIYDQMALVSSNSTMKNGTNFLMIPTTDGAMPESLVTATQVNFYEYHVAETYTLDYLLKRFLGTVVQFEFTGDSTAVIKNVRILSANPIIIQTIDNGKIYLSPSGQFIFPSLPQIDDQNYFLVSTDATSLSYSYMTNGIGWNAYYTVNIDDSSMNGKIELWNKTDTTFKNFNLAFLSGTAFTSRNTQPQMAKAFATAYEAAPSIPSVQNIGGYKIYSYGKVDELDADSAVFLSLFSKKVKIDKLNVVYNPSQNFGNAVQVAKVLHDFAVPAGTVNLYTTKDGMTYFLGQTDVTDTASMVSLDLQYGQNFDLGAKQVEIQRSMVSKDLYDHTYQITAINSSSNAENLWIYITIPSNAIVTATPANVQFERSSTTQIRFYLSINPNSEKSFNYGLQTDY